ERLRVGHAEVVGDALYVGTADERLVTAAAFGTARRTRDVLRHILEVFARHVDDAADYGDERRVVVVFIDPLAMRDLVGVVIARRLFVEGNGDVLFVDLDFVDVLERPRVEQLGVRRLSGPARIVL